MVRTDAVTAGELTALRRNSTDTLDELERQLAALVAATEGANTDDEHDPEGATIAFERAQLVESIAVTRRRLSDLDAAASRLASGTYGVCEACGRPIGDQRLAARPATRTCVDCAGSGRRTGRGATS